jgi:hypothetical protein
MVIHVVIHVVIWLYMWLYGVYMWLYATAPATRGPRGGRGTTGGQGTRGCHVGFITWAFTCLARGYHVVVTWALITWAVTWAVTWASRGCHVGFTCLARGCHVVVTWISRVCTCDLVTWVSRG